MAKRRKKNPIRSVLRTVYTIVFLILTLASVSLSVYGVYGMSVLGPKAVQAQKEIEEMLKRQQEEADRMIQERREQLAAATPVPTEEPEAEIGVYNGPETLADRYTRANEMNVVGIGDSVMLAALEECYDEFPHGYFDARFGRTIYEGLNVLIEMEEQDRLGEALVLGLSTNCDIYYETCCEIMSHTKDVPTFWLTAYGVSNGSRPVLDAVVAAYPNAHLIDWDTLAMAHQSEWILADGLHPNDIGSRAYAKLIDDVITDTLLHKEANTIPALTK